MSYLEILRFAREHKIEAYELMAANSAEWFVRDYCEVKESDKHYEEYFNNIAGAIADIYIKTDIVNFQEIEQSLMDYRDNHPEADINDIASNLFDCINNELSPANNDVNLKQNAKEKFENLIYQRGLSDFEWDNYSEQIRWLLEADMNKEELLELGYEEEYIDQELEEVKEELKTNDRER